MFTAAVLFIAAAFYLAIIMPSNPAAIGTSYTPSTPGAPAAPRGSYTPTTPASPSAPGAGYTPGSPGAPAACGKDYHPAGVVISGVLEPDVTGYVPMRGVISGKPWCASTETFDGPEDAEHLRVAYAGTRWVIVYFPTGTTGPGSTWRAAPGNEATPDLAGGWEPDSGSDIEPTGVPVLRWIAPPAAPIAPGTGYVPATPSSPSAPGTGYTPATPSSPSAPGTGYTPATPAAPSAPGVSFNPGTPANPAGIGVNYTPSTPNPPAAIGS